MIQTVFKDREFLRSAAKLAIPISFQSLIQASLGMIDQVMVGQLGETAVAGVGLGGRIPFIFSMIIAGITSATSIYVAQYWGKKDTDNIKQVMGSTLSIGMLIAVICMGLSLLIPQQAVSLFSRDSAVIRVGASYLAIVSLSFIPVLITGTYSAVLRSTHHVRLTLFAGMAAVVINTVLNYILIFGYLGMPKMGAEGTAVATAISKLIECLIILAAVYAKKLPGCTKLRDLIFVKSSFFKVFMVTALPLLINEFVWSLGESIYTGIYGVIGTKEATSMIITYPIQSICISVFVGVASAAGVVVGNKLGEDEYEAAYDYAKKFLVLGMMGAVMVGIIITLLSGLYVRTYKISADAQRDAIILIAVFGAVLLVKISNMIIGGGILRSGGKTKLTLYLDMLGTWGIGIPMGLLGAFVFKMPVYVIYMMITVEEVVRFIIGIVWMRRRIWINNIVNEVEEAAS